MNIKKELSQEEINKMVEEEILKENKTTTETGEKSTPISKAIRKVLGEALLKEFGGCTPEPYDPYKECPMKYRKAQKIIRIIDSMLMRIVDTYHMSQGEPDEMTDKDLKDMMTSSTKAVIGAAINKLQAIWNTNEEETKEISASPDEGTVVIVKNETLKSPQNKEYIIEEIVDDEGIIILKEKGTNATCRVSIDIAKKWKLK